MANSKNEAKIQFIAETGEFNKSIKDANNELKGLRAEAKLNEAQMKLTGTSIDGLKDKQQNLQQQLQATQDKTAALSEKLDAAKRIYGENSDEAAKLRVELAKNQTSEINLQKAINDCSDELKEAEKAMDGAGDEAKDLSGSVKKAGKSASDAKGGFTVMKGALAGLVKDGISWAIGKLSDLIKYFVELPSATKELRQDMATLTTAFDNVGLSAETATATWKELYAVFGEDDRAVEAANNIARMSDSQKNLDDWLTITTGVWATYQDALPVEGLAEAAGETAKVGTVTGSFADALNWSSEAAIMFAGYMSEDVTTAEDAFNVALSECTTEQERQALVTDTLTKLYGSAASKYRETSAAQMEAKEVAAENILVENELAAAIEPVTTAYTDMKNKLIVDILPAVSNVVSLITDRGIPALTNAYNWASQHKGLLTAIAVVIGVVTTAIIAYNAVQAIKTAMDAVGTATVWGFVAAETASAAATFAALAPFILIVAAIAAVIAIIILCVKHWDEIKTAAAKAAEWIKNAWSTVASWFDAHVIQPIVNLWNTLKNAVKTAIEFIRSMAVAKFQLIKAAIIDPIVAAKDKVKEVIDKIKSFFNFTVTLPKIKLPHFSITPKGWKIGDLLEGSIPKLGIEWYAKGGIMTSPTIFGMNGGRLMGGGEAGPEAILPIDNLQTYISAAIDKTLTSLNLAPVVNAIEDLADRPNVLTVNGREFALATAGDSDRVNGERLTLKARGLAL